MHNGFPEWPAINKNIPFQGSLNWRLLSLSAFLFLISLSTVWASLTVLKANSAFRKIHNNTQAANYNCYMVLALIIKRHIKRPIHFGFGRWGQWRRLYLTPGHGLIYRSKCTFVIGSTKKQAFYWLWHTFDNLNLWRLW